MGEDRIEAEKTLRAEKVSRQISVLNVNEEIGLRKWKGKGNSEINLC